MNAVIAGQSFEVPYPFVRVTVELPPDDPEANQMATVESWRPGVEWSQDSPYCEAEAAADGIGAMLLTVIDVHKPGRFPARVFFTRQWRDPDGKVFGKSGLRITTVPAFLRRTKGYMHEFYLNGDLVNGGVQ